MKQWELSCSVGLQDDVRVLERVWLFLVKLNTVSHD